MKVSQLISIYEHNATIVFWKNNVDFKLVKKHKQLVLVTHVYNPTNWKTEAGELSLIGLHRETWGEGVVERL